MNSNRIIIALLAAAVALQGATLWRQSHSAATAPSRKPAVRDVPAGTFLSVNGLPADGATAPSALVMVEFSDYECPYCAKFATDIEPRIDSEYVQQGKLVHMFANNPLPMHQNARLLAIAAACAGQQGHYWEMYRALFRSKPKGAQDIRVLAATIGVAEKEFESCFREENAGIQLRLQEDVENAKRLGLDGTPSFGLGWLQPDGRVMLKTILVGAQPVEVFTATIDKLLSSGPS